MTSPKITHSTRAAQSALLDWFSKNQRPLPWRKDYVPYEVWISEIMLQQTQMNTMLPYYERWMKRFPDLAALAKADLKSVLKAWEGLGYYSRARNLHESAKRIVQIHGGVFPRDFDAIQSLKGIGRYTAGAISSIAYNDPRPIVDGNIFRVLSRLYAIDKPIDVEKNREEFWQIQESLIPPGHAREFNQALMELGALVCSPATPACALCPLQKHCRAYALDRAEDFPVKSKKAKSVKITAAALVLENQGRFLIELRPLGEIMGGLWEFPEWKLTRNRPLTAAQAQKKLLCLIEERFSFPAATLKHLKTIQRNYTYFNETLFVFHVKNYTQNKWGCPATGPANPKSDGLEESAWEQSWIRPKDFSKYPFSSAHAKITQLIREIL